MESFLNQVARHYYEEGGISGKCFIFPNRRSLVFFRQSLAHQVKGTPVIAPEMYTMNDFLLKCSGRTRADKVHLLLILYECYKKLNPSAEPLDEFIFWGDVLLSDFDDVDKYLVNTDHIFANISDYKSIQDTYSYLEPQQLEAIRRFVSHFRGEEGLRVDMDSKSSYKARFLKIWDILGELYHSFNEALDRKGFCYEGQYYRELARSEESISDVLAGCFPYSEKFVFVGLNALSESEKTVLRRMRNARIAEFCWDYCGDMIRSSRNKSSLFLSRNVQEFPQAFEPEGGNVDTEFRVIGVPSGVGQAKVLPGLLPDGTGIETAIVIPDENMLMPVLNSIPSGISELNVTMGCPMSGSQMWALMDAVASLKLRLREKDGKWFFYHKSVRSVLSNGLLKDILDESGLDTASRVRKEARYYIPETAFKGSDPLLELIFRPLPDDIPSIGRYQMEIVAAVAARIRDNAPLAAELDFAKDYYLALGKLLGYGLDIQPATFFRLLKELVSGTSVPFRGEPLKGLQIMGPLETRALDFDNVIILSANEGVFPRSSVSASFIPPELRKGFGLPSYEFQDAVWAYYFYRLICRAKTVTMLYDTRTDFGRSGEQSRYIRQLELDYGVAVRRYIASSPVSVSRGPAEIEKTLDDIAEVKKHYLSASALQNYLACPAKFYYSSVKRLKPEAEVSEVMDAGMMGNAFHETMEALYKDRGTVSADYLKGLLKKGDGTVRDIVCAKILGQIKSFEISGRNIIYADVVERYVKKVLERDLELMDEYKVSSFKILGTELPREFTIEGFKFIGFIDRLDSFVSDEVRVVDYKTGKVTDKDFDINDGNAEEVVEQLFAPDIKDRPKIALQMYLYDCVVSKMYPDRKIVNSIYQTSRLFTESVRKVEINSRFRELMAVEIKRLLEEISDTWVPWRRTCDPGVCDYCDFKTLCGR